jgi:hypothetical protein
LAAGGGRTSDADRGTETTTPSVNANTNTPQRTTTVPRKNRGQAKTTQQTVGPVQPTSTAGTVLTRRPTAAGPVIDTTPGPVTILHAIILLPEK